VNHRNSPLESLKTGNWFKSICGASFNHLPAVRNLSLAYTIAGVDCIDVSADPAVIAAAKEGMQAAGDRPLPWLMASLNDGEDPHFRKAQFDPDRCPVDCPRPCEAVCPAIAINASGVIDSRCYGCGRCLPICPYGYITTRSYVTAPEVVVPMLLSQGIDAIEIHTQVGRLADFQRLWRVIQPGLNRLKLISISCPDDADLIPYLRSLYDLMSPLPIPLIWQTDGRPMSGDIGKGSTIAAIKLAAKVLNANLPGYVQLAGGTNDRTVPKLGEMGLLAASGSPAFVAGVAYGSYARKLLLPTLDRLENAVSNTDFPSPSAMRLENYPDLLQQATQQARTLVSQLKHQCSSKN